MRLKDREIPGLWNCRIGVFGVLILHPMPPRGFGGAGVGVEGPHLLPSPQGVGKALHGHTGITGGDPKISVGSSPSGWCCQICTVGLGWFGTFY